MQAKNYAAQVVKSLDAFISKLSEVFRKKWR